MRALQAVLAVTVAAILGLTFAWPAIAPEGREGFAYQVAAVAALWTFLAVLAALLWIKACKAPRI